MSKGDPLRPQTYEQAVLEIGRIGGFAPGGYISICHQCGKHFDGDKRAVTCLPCVVSVLRTPATAQSRPEALRVYEALRHRFDSAIRSAVIIGEIEAALSVSALPVPVGGNSFSSVGITSPIAKYPSPSLDSTREPAFVEALAIAQYEARARMHRAFTLYSPESWSGLRQGQKEREVAAMWEAFATVDGSQAPPVPVGGGEALSALDCTQSLMMASGWWTNKAGHLTDAALWIDKAVKALTPAKPSPHSEEGR